MADTFQIDMVRKWCPGHRTLFSVSVLQFRLGLKSKFQLSRLPQAEPSMEEAESYGPKAGVMAP